MPMKERKWNKNARRALTQVSATLNDACQESRNTLSDKTEWGTDAADVVSLLSSSSELLTMISMRDYTRNL